MDKTILKNLYSHNIIFDDVTPIRQTRETYNYAIVNNLYIHKDTKKNLPQEAETDNSIIKNHIKTFLHGSHTGSLHEQYLNVV